MKSRGILTCLLTISLLCGCASSGNEPVINKIGSPAWIESGSKAKTFSAVGKTTYHGGIKNVINKAETEAKANLKKSIKNKLELFFNDEFLHLTSDKYAENIARTRSISTEIANELDLEKLAYRDAMWVNPDNDDTYILMVVDNQFVLEKVNKKIDKVSENYRYDDEFVAILKEAKIDAKNNFRARKRKSEFENAEQTSLQSNDKISEAMLLHAIQGGK
ncbi:MAG: hypothetical protein IJT14_02950 [Rickettsiales bacterium]|nr:hypothetical protein [Rickettsiales bacterium]